LREKEMTQPVFATDHINQPPSFFCIFNQVPARLRAVNNHSNIEKLQKKFKDELD
jgi:hypothetical protein